MRMEMYERTLKFAARVIIMLKTISPDTVDVVLVKQLARCATSIGANYREACHARSASEFASKLKICEGEANESLYWLLLLVETGIVSERKMSALIAEARELVAILTASTKKAYQKLSGK